MSLPIINIAFDIEHIAPARLTLFAGDSVQVKARLMQYGEQYVVPEAATAFCYVVPADGVGYWKYDAEVSDDGCLVFTFTPSQIQDYGINLAWFAFEIDEGQSIRYPMQLKIIPTPDLTVDPLPPPTVALTPEQIAWLASRVPIVMPDGATWWVKQEATYVDGEVFIKQVGEPEECPFVIS